MPGSLVRTRLPVVALYSATLVVSAALVFMVQPMFARFVLPLLGGSPAVWTTAMLFFQSALLLAYVYAHWTTRRFGPRRQAALHLVLVAAALLVVPIGVPDWTPPGSGSPVLWLLAVLVVTVGLPFFVVSATAPLLQAWLAATDHPDAEDPYFLYRASNIGSVLGLLSYPLLVEPRLTLDDQALIWSAGFGALALLLIASAMVLWRSRSATESQPVVEASAEPLSRGRRLRWIALAFIPSSLMLGTTAALTTNLAPIPLLWVLPLSLYLLSFIVVFSRGRRSGLGHRLSRFALPPLLIVLAGVVTLGINDPLWLIGLVYLVTFFVVALFCHGELAGDRPPASQLTQFYVLLSVGGALGGVFNVIVAPLAFNSLTELPVVLLLVCFLRPMRGEEKWTDRLSFLRHVLPPLVLGLATFGALFLADGAKTPEKIAYVAAGLLCLAMVRQPMRFGLALVAIMSAVWLSKVDDWMIIHQDRSFFAAERVESFDGLAHVLRNGTIVHGAQLTLAEREPLTYYHRTGPLGQLLEAVPDRSITRRSGVVGLGTGTMACYARPGDRWTFFEIDEAVVRVARDPALFTYLQKCPGRKDVVLGDARLSLKRQPDRRYGFLALDAFSSDAIPIHLMTRESLELYRRKLAPHGVLAVHISNRYLDLEPEVGNVAHAAGMACFAQVNGITPKEKTMLKFSSHWVAVARRPSDLGRVARDARWHPCRRDRDARPWSDDYSNVLRALRWR